MGLKLAVDGSCHVFCANHWSSELLEFLSLLACVVCICIDMEGYNITLTDLCLIKLFEVITPVPWAWWNWLWGEGCSSPEEGILQEWKRCFNVATISWFIVDIPKIHSIVISECANHIQEVLLIQRVQRFISNLCCSWWLDPSWVVDSLNWIWLLSQVSLWIPTVVKHGKHSLNSMWICYCQEIIKSMLESLCILLPNKRVEENSYNLHSNALCVYKLSINSSSVIGLSLPHFKSIDSSTWDEVASSEPFVLLPPCVGLLWGEIISKSINKLLSCFMSY